MLVIGTNRTWVDKIIKGAKPGELPIEQAALFKFVIVKPQARLD
jgi:hypothetical protein